MASTATREGSAAVSFMINVAPGLTCEGASSVTACVRAPRSAANGATPYDSGLMNSSGDAGSRRNCTLT